MIKSYIFLIVLTILMSAQVKAETQFGFYFQVPVQPQTYLIQPYGAVISPPVYIQRPYWSIAPPQFRDLDHDSRWHDYEEHHHHKHHDHWDRRR